VGVLLGFGCTIGSPYSLYPNGEGLSLNNHVGIISKKLAKIIHKHFDYVQIGIQMNGNVLTIFHSMPLEP
jgi:hypothetical protein